jgi:cobalt-zinc-cadmium efflux system outer membrane protein
MALGGNPAVGQAAARVRALRGKYCQVGLMPNPTVGYLGSEIGNDGAAGQQGAFVGQELVTAGKLTKNRAVVAAEIEQAEQQLAAARRRVLTDVRQSFYRALVAERRVEVTSQLVVTTGKAVKSSQDLLELQEIPTAALLQTEVEQQNARLLLRTAENERRAAWQALSAVVGDENLPEQPLVGDPTQLPQELAWQAELERLTSHSPEIGAAAAELIRARRALQRACVEATPNVATQLSVQYDDSTSYTVAGVQVGVALPLWNRNQGGICQAQSEVTVASQNIERVALGLQRRLSNAFRRYADARAQVEIYAGEILPRADRTFELIGQGYAQGEMGYLDLLTAQRTYAQTNLAYLDALGALWQSWAEIDGLLLRDSLGGE